MTFVSYAQNFEDVLLWRALGAVADGFYIDIGAGHPDTDSVTRAFYDRGWHGINVEPTAEYSLRLHAARNRDLNLRLLVGAHAGQARLFAVEGTGLSTVDAEAAAVHAAAGRVVREEELPVETLAGLCQRHAPAVIHFLKIDVEGAERAVLEGADFSAWRPWIVVVEATAPLTTISTHAAWEPILLRAGYRFVWFDGLNRFYIAEEQAAALAPHFLVPPNVFDDFVRAADSELARRVSEADLRAAELVERNQAIEARASAAAAEAARAQSRSERQAEEIMRLRETLAANWEHAEAVERRARLADERTRLIASWLNAMRASTSWRVTAPLRGVRGMLGRGGAQDVPPMEALALAAAPAPEAPPAPVDASTPAPRIPRRGVARHLATVHQFHAGSAVGDAITNSMLLMRRQLHALGYAGDIFVEYRDPALAHELRLIDELPAHDSYVLILHHSMGFDGFARVAALPAPKVLMYHNITPPEFLSGAAVHQKYAKLGREQLAALRDHVVTALADSEYNAIELRGLGFDGAQSCTMLFDIDTLLAAAAQPVLAEPECFTILFVGRVVPAKGQTDLVDAFAAFSRRFGAPCRLVLVGRHDGEDSFYVRQIQDRAVAGDVAGRVLLTGLVSDEELHRWYASADLFVSMSWHEGFGVPLVEAMAHGVPVLARPSGAVPYTLGMNDGLLHEDDAASVAARMLALATDRAERADLLRRQSEALERFALHRQTPHLLHALALAGAKPPASAESRRLIAANLHYAVTGHVNGSYSLASINRTLAVQLEAMHEGRVRLLPIEGEPTSVLSDVPAADRDILERLVARRPPLSGPEMVISQHYPVHVPPVPGVARAALFFWEESVIPPETVAVLNENFDLVLAPSSFVAKTLVDSGVALPVHLLGFAPRLDGWHRGAQARAPRVGRAFTFLHVSSCFPRKGVDALLAAYARAFRHGDNVRLVIKGFPNPHNDVAAQLARLRAQDPGMAPVELIDRDMDEAALLDLYAQADAMVLPTRGEGYNMPAAEALAAGLHVIVTGHGGHMDFCAGGDVRLVEYSFANSGSHLASAGSVWVEPDMADLAAALREAPDAPTIAAMSPDPRAVMRRLDDIAIEHLLARPPTPQRIGFITSWDVRCGVAEYSRHLVENFPASPRIAALSVYCDRRTRLELVPDDAPIRPLPCWDLGMRDGTAEIEAAIGRDDPDIVVVQHQPGLFGWPALATLLQSGAMRARRVVVTLHNTRHLGEIAAAQRATAIAALAGVARVLVHTVEDLNWLKSLGLVENVTLFPHGTPQPAASPRPARVLGSTSFPLIGCYGFFLPNKGIPQLVQALATLRAQYPSVRLRLVNADYGSAESKAEIAACRALAEEEGVLEAIEFHTTFLAHEASMALLAECDVIALPYQGTLEASSAALRTALSAGPPVAVTPIPLFNEAGAAVFRLPGTGPEALAAGLLDMLRDPALRAGVQQGAAAWLAPRAWPTIATRLQGMLLGLAAAPAAAPSALPDQAASASAPFDRPSSTPSITASVRAS